MAQPIFIRSYKKVVLCVFSKLKTCNSILYPSKLGLIRSYIKLVYK